MKLIMRVVCVAVPVLFIVGCASELARVDLNGDKKTDVVFGVNTTGHFYYADYLVAADLSMSDGTYQKKSLIKLRGQPDRAWFEDIDNDGDLDLRCRLSSKSRWDHVVDGDYVSWNDGNGNFSRLEPTGNATLLQGRSTP